ncbi:zinc finger protein 718 [Helicoverpa armigera]|uniref:zinc finger protein 718 n=1 Tax=Helicoverpa armigera TaxID=29058 RepID=UPI003082A15D
MSSFLCFICHSTVNADTNEEIREKYREIVGMSLCPDSHLCYICCHMVNKLWLFKSICLKRSLEYPVLFSEKGTINLQKNEIETVIICSEENCLPTNILQLYVYNRDQSTHSSDYMKLEEEGNDFEDYFEGQVEDNGVKEGEECKNTEDNIPNHNENCEDSNDIENNGSVHSNSEDVHLKQETTDEFELKDIGEENEINYEFYEEERNECLDEIRNGSGNEDGNEESDSKKKKSKKSKKKGFEKILLTAEEQKAELEAQRRSKKYTEAEFKCYNCALGFLFKDTYQAHMMRHEESNGEYVCQLCSLRFATGAVLRAHCKLHSTRHRCTVCSAYIRARQTQTHAKRCHDSSSVATCHLCGRVFQDASGLQQHLKRFHGRTKSNRTYSCNICGKNFKNQAAVRTHMLTHINRKFTCDQCPSIFSSPYTLNQHKKKHTTTELLKEHYCTTCGVGYTSRKSLLAHLRNSGNHQERSYECVICNRSCPNERSLNSHMSSVHSSSKDFGCSTCGAKYASRKSLVRHVGTHTARPQPSKAVCHHCGNSFKGKSKLNRHLREVCEKDKLEEELSAYYDNVISQ